MANQGLEGKGVADVIAQWLGHNLDVFMRLGCSRFRAAVEECQAAARYCLCMSSLIVDACSSAAS